MKTLKEVNYQRLPEVVTGFKGLKIPGMSAQLIDRTETAAIYHRWDDVYEVFRIKIREEGTAFDGDKVYPRREMYPNNEDFGRIAWCYKDEALAMKRYNVIRNQTIDISTDIDDNDE